MICEFCKQEFDTENQLAEHIKQSIENGKRIGGKFALLARILEGDEAALEQMQQLIEAGIIGPGFDNIPSIN